MDSKLITKGHIKKPLTSYIFFEKEYNQRIQIFKIRIDTQGEPVCTNTIALQFLKDETREFHKIHNNNSKFLILIKISQEGQSEPNISLPRSIYYWISSLCSKQFFLVSFFSSLTDWSQNHKHWQQCLNYFLLSIFSINLNSLSHSNYQHLYDILN
jgi:hypothetical protein